MIELFSTCPPSSGSARDAYVSGMIDVAR